MIYNFFRYWFLLIAGASALYGIDFMQDLEGSGLAGFMFMAFVPAIFSITVVSLCLAIFVASPKKVNNIGSGGVPQNDSAFSNSGEIVKLSILGVSFVISAYFLIGSLI
jgi:hypothetical protein